MTVGVFANGERRLLVGGKYMGREEIIASMLPLILDAGHSPEYARHLAEILADANLGQRLPGSDQRTP